MAYIYDLSDAWTAAGTTFTAIKMNVTDTASASGSLLMDLQVGGVSLVRVNKSGHIKAVNRVLINSGASETGIQTDGGDDILLKSANIFTAKAAALAFVVPSTSSFSFAASATATDTPDTILRRDAANTLAQRNGVNAQAFNLYNTYTDASNYERGFMRFVSNVLEIGTQAAGTGTNRGVTIKAGTQSWVFDASVGTTSFPNSISLGASANIQLQPASTVAFSTRGLVEFPADGVARFFRSFGAGFERIVFQDSTSAGASLKRSATSLQARLGDDSAFTNIQGKLTTDTAYTAGAPTATGYITLYDSTGTAYRVPCVV